ncbi:hypothetical protein Pint_17125 [Pistacia integerrima]|uniref:Uncharacterized protein n=1 Tax=Pistacia integerrima TaxID=434235 RepID=A0ACC0YU50_9ROSI|nr:hypothetical protein Pint_17125 [Pistacia integerrima]
MPAVHLDLFKPVLVGDRTLFGVLLGTSLTPVRLSILVFAYEFTIRTSLKAFGVRREVGIHAKTLNNLLSKTQQVNSTVSQDTDNVIDCQQGDSSKLKMDSLGPTPLSSTNVPPLLLKQTKQMLMSSVEEGSERSGDINSAVLKESIGHTEVEVIAGALLGFFVSLAVYAIV